MHIHTLPYLPDLAKFETDILAPKPHGIDNARSHAMLLQTCSCSFPFKTLWGQRLESYLHAQVLRQAKPVIGRGFLSVNK